MRRRLPDRGDPGRRPERPDVARVARSSTATRSRCGGPRRRRCRSSSTRARTRRRSIRSPRAVRAAGSSCGASRATAAAPGRLRPPGRAQQRGRGDARLRRPAPRALGLAVSLYTWTKGIAAGAYLCPRCSSCSGQLEPSERARGRWAAPLAGGRRSWRVTGGLLHRRPRASRALLPDLHAAAVAELARARRRSSSPATAPCSRRTCSGGALGRGRGRARSLVVGVPLAVADGRLHRLAVRAGARRATSGRARCCRRTFLVAGRARRAPPRCCRSPRPSSPARSRCCWITVAGPRSLHLLLIAGGGHDSRHATAHARLAAREMTRGRYRWFFRPGVRSWSRLVAVLAGARRARHARGPSPACSPTSTRTCRRGSRCRWPEPMSERKSDRVSASRSATEGAARPSTRAEPHPPGAVSAERALGRLGRSSTRRRGRGASSAATCSCRRPASTASRPAACSPTSTTRRCEVRKFEGNPEHPGLARTQLRQGAGDAQPGHRPRPHPLSAQARRQARRGQLGARVAGTRRSTTSPRASARRIVEDRPQRGHVPRRAGPAKTASPSACSPPGASTATTRTPTSARRAARAGYQLWMGFDRPSPDHANAERHPPHQRAPRVGPLLQPARAARHRRQGERREAHRLRHAPLEHRHARRPLGRALSRVGSRDPARDRELPDPERSLQPRVRAPLVELAGVPGGRAAGRPTPRSRTSRRRSTSSTPSTRFEFAAAESGVDAAVHRRRSRGSWPTRRHAALALTTGAARPPATCGGWQVARTLFMLNALLGAVADRRRRLPERLEQVRAAADLHAAAPADVERAHLAARVSRSR